MQGLHVGVRPSDMTRKHDVVSPLDERTQMTLRSSSDNSSAVEIYQRTESNTQRPSVSCTTSPVFPDANVSTLALFTKPIICQSQTWSNLLQVCSALNTTCHSQKNTWRPTKCLVVKFRFVHLTSFGSSSHRCKI